MSTFEGMTYARYRVLTRYCQRHAAIPYVAAALLCAIYLFSVFLNIPINTEARDYVYFHGYLADIGRWSSLIYPAGTNQRLVSMVVFSLSRDGCGFSAPCLNTIQIAELLGCFALGTLHLHQLLGRPLIVACCMLVWALSPPVFMAGFWQATQHDKLAFLFAFAALSLGLRALGGGSLPARLAASLGVTMLFVLAINSKEIAFFLPAAAIAQILLFAPGAGFRARVAAGAVYAVPVAYAAAYTGAYLWHLGGVWHQHVLSGDIGTNIGYYAETLSGSRPASPPVICAATGLLAVSIYMLVRRPERRSLSATLYFAVICAASLTLVLKAQYPSDYYLMITDWAVLGWIASVLVVARPFGMGVRAAVHGLVCVLGIGFAVGRFDEFWAGGASAEILSEAQRVSAGYHVLSRYCGTPMQAGLKLVFAKRPAGSFYFFRGGGEGNDPRLGRFICDAGPAPIMSYSFDGDARQTQPGQLVAVWNRDLRLTTISKDGVSLNKM